MIVFALKSAITLALLYSCFFLFLSKETFHRFNRVMLIMMLVASLIVPFIHLTTEHPTIVNSKLYTAELTLQTQYPVEPNMKAASLDNAVVDYNWVDTIALIYLIGFAVMVAFTVFQLVLITREIKGGLRHKDGRGNTIVLKPGKFAPFSFFHFIVMSVDDYEQNRQAILTHEQEHVRLLHSWDNLLVTMMKILQWFNPFIYLLSLDLDAIHEFEADEAVIDKGVDTLTYQQLLAAKATGRQFPTLANGLNRSSLKRRIIMMCQSPSSHWLMLKAIVALPVVVLTISAFASPKISQPIANTLEKVDPEMKNTLQAIRQVVTPEKNVAENDQQDINKQKEKEEANIIDQQESTETTVAIKKPYFIPPTCPYDFNQYIVKNMRIPEYARENHISSSVVVLFSVDTDGRIKDVRVGEPTHPLLDNEAIRLVSEMPKWKPATVNGKVDDDCTSSVIINFVTNRYTD